MVSFTVSVVAPGVGTPTGSVTVSDGTSSCTGTVAAGACTIAFTSAGPKMLTASYAGDGSFGPSTSLPQAHTVNLANTTVNITSDAPDPSVVGVPLPVTYTVTVLAPAAGTPTGTVTITDGVDTCTVPVAAGACNMTLTTVGGRFLTATYSGDANYGGSTSIPQPHMVAGPPAVSQINSVANTGDGQIVENERTNVGVTQLLVIFNKDMNADTPGDLNDVLTITNYSLVQGATVIPVNPVITYNAATHTATLDVNGGAALPDGAYTLTVMGRIEDTLGVPIGTDFVRHFVVDTVGPRILTNGVAGQPGNVVITDGGVYSNRFGSFTLSFNEDVSNAGGGSGVDDATNPLNYLLLSAGPNGTYETTTCQAFVTNGNLPLADDVRVPSGPVTYSNNGGGGPFVASVTVNGGTPLSVGEYRLLVCGSTSIVDLVGNPLNDGSDSGYTFSQTATMTTITADLPDPSVVGQTVTFAYSVSVDPPGAGTPTGNVTVSNGTQSCTGTVAAGACVIALTTPSSTSFTATYPGDASFAGSTSAPVTHTVNQASTATTITSDTPDPSVVGQSVTFSFTVAAVAPGAGTPTGNVTVSDGTNSCTATVAAGTCTITITTAGTTNFTATYAGDTSFVGSTSAPAPHTVNQATTTTGITSDLPDPSVVGEPVSIGFTVTPVPPAAGTPTGSVTIPDGTSSCTATVAAGACTIGFTTVGAKTLTATYGGDANFTGSTSATVAHTVNAASTTTVITSDLPDPSGAGAPLNVAFSVTVVVPGVGTPTGNVAVSDGVNSCTAPVAAGACTLVLTTIGARSLVATYSGDANFTGSTSAAEPHTVGGPPVVSLINSAADTGDGQLVENERTNVGITQLLVVFSSAMDPSDVSSPANYQLTQGASMPIAVNGVNYGPATQTATLLINSGAALPDGAYTFTIGSTIRDTLGTPIGTDFVRHFVIDTIAPHILTDGVAGQPGNVVITDGGVYSTRFSSLTVTFNEDVSDAGGGAGVDDVTNPLNYLLLRAGTNGTYETTTCQAFATNGNWPLGDDVRVPSGPVTYSNGGGSGPFIAHVTVNGGMPLNAGEYRLLVCGSTSVVDLAGNPLNGGSDSRYAFSFYDNAIPTMNEIGLLVLALLVAIAGLWILLRR
jgi:hypothetical protein